MDAWNFCKLVYHLCHHFRYPDIKRQAALCCTGLGHLHPVLLIKEGRAMVSFGNSGSQLDLGNTAPALSDLQWVGCINVCLCVLRKKGKDSQRLGCLLPAATSTLVIPGKIRQLDRLEERWRGCSPASPAGHPHYSWWHLGSQVSTLVHIQGLWVTEDS